MSYALDAALEVIRPVLSSREPAQALIAAKCYGLALGYGARWSESPYRIDGAEAVLASDLFNPETSRKSRTFLIAGKLDVRATEIATGRSVIIDHKTCSQDIADPNAPYWQQLVIEGQVTHYHLLEWLNGNKVDAAVWDVLRKPGISPKALSKKDCEFVLRDQTYFGTELESVDVEYLRETGRESHMMYACRLAQDCSGERPEWYFQRRQVPRMDSEVREYAQELWDNGQDMIAARANNRWPRNSGHCMNYNTPCKFLGLCSGHDQVDSGRWATKEYVHNELPIMGQGDGRDVLTNSRMRVFQSCRRKHYLSYELGIERLDEEEREVLFFGNLWHSALEQFFLALMKRSQLNAVTT